VIDSTGLLHNMSVPPKSVVKYEGLSGLATLGSPGGSGVTGVSYKNRKHLFGLPVRFELSQEWRGLSAQELLLQLQLDVKPGKAAEQDPDKRLITLINECANALPLPEGCAVIASDASHAVLWSDPLCALAILSKCTQSVWLRSKTPSLIAAQQCGPVSLLVPPNFVNQLPSSPC
jgi:hypothetical protein